MKIFRRGQASIEFALILPIFAMLLFALVYVGFLFIDVVTLDSAAAAAARSAAMNDGVVSKPIKEKIKATRLFMQQWYTIDSESPKRILDKEKPENDEYIFTYGIKANRTTNNAILKMFLPEAYTVVKSAYKSTDENEGNEDNEGGSGG